jgi:hypothetical protein
VGIVTLASGKSEYTLGVPPVVGHGVSLTQTELDAGVAGPIANTLFDEAGILDIAGMLSDVAGTDFKKSELQKALSGADEPEPWRVGEAIAETYLSHHRSCVFPWPDGRDIRKSGSSLPGADLVGFQIHGAESRFAFGEVKTSSDDDYPPGVMYGETGLKQQLEDLRDKVELRHNLVLYLAHRAHSAAWKANFCRAFERFNNNNGDISILGALVRDVSPHVDDLRTRVEGLARSVPPGMNLVLVAIYLPVDSIGGLGKALTAARGGGPA